MAILMLASLAGTADADSYNHRGGFGWESYFMSTPFSYGGYFGQHYGGPGGILSGAAPHYGNYAGWYSRHYVIGLAPWKAIDGSLNRTWDERYNPSHWNYDGISRYVNHPRDDWNDYIPESAGTIAEAHNLHLELHVRVPSDARVYLNGHETTSTGTTRRFVTESVRGRGSYPFEVRAVVERDGEEIERIQQVEVHPGDPEDVSFNFPENGRERR